MAGRVTSLDGRNGNRGGGGCSRVGTGRAGRAAGAIAFVASSSRSAAAAADMVAAIVKRRDFVLGGRGQLLDLL